MQPLKLDHITLFADNLANGAGHVRSCLDLDQRDIETMTGGSHPLMGTHNLLLKLGDDCFLEIISTDPAAPKPARARWFQLDNPIMRVPYLGTWITRTQNIDAAISEAPKSLGPAIDVTRDDLRWQITVPDDGSLIDDGAFPALIQWPDGPHPALKMTDLGCTLNHLIIEHPSAAELAAHFALRLDDPRVVFHTGDHMRLTAEITTPQGIRTLF